MRKLKLFFACMLLTLLSVGQMWGAPTEESVTLSSGSFSTDHITWSAASGKITISQLKGNSSTAVNSSYVSAPRVYKGHVLSFVAADGYKINSIEITCNGTYYGNSMTAGTVYSSNTVTDNTTDVSRTWTSTSGGKHVVSAVDEGGLSAIYIQNVASSTNTQLRFTELKISYTTSGSGSNPSLSVAPTTIDFGTVDQNAEVEDKTVAVTFANLTGSVTYSGLSGAFSASGSISASGDAITIAANTATVGNYSQTLTVQSTADSKSQDVTVKMNVVAPFNGLQLTFPDEGSDGSNVSSYTTSWTATIGTQSWSIYGFNTNKWGWNPKVIKTGRKNNSGTAQPLTATIVTQVTDHAVGDIVVTVDAVTAAQITSHKLYVADNSEFTNAIEIEGDPATIAAGNITYTVPTANRANDLYYKLEYATAGTASSNGTLTISKITYAYATAAPQKQSTGLAYADADKNNLVKVGASFTAPNLMNPNTLSDITYASSDANVVAVDASTGDLTINAAGKAVITASRDEDNTYKAGSASYTIYVANEAGTAADPLSEASAKTLIDLGCTMEAHVHGVVQGEQDATKFTVTLAGGMQFYKLKDLGNVAFETAYIKNRDEVTAVGSLLKYNNSTYELEEGCYLTAYTEYTEPVVTLKQSGSTVTSLNLDATGVANQAIDVECTNFADAISSVTAELYEESTCETKITSGAWVTDITVNDANNQVTFNVADNAGEARQVWMKVTASDGTDEASAVLAISQAKYTVDYAELPFEFDGGRADIATTNGMTQEGLDTDYGSSPKLKFNSTGDVVIIKINADPGILTYDIKNNSFSEGTFTVQQSADGENYTNVAEYTTITGTQNESKTLAQTTRYVKFIYTSKVNGNVALGNIAIAPYVAPTACEAPAFTPESGESFTESLDVTLATATEGATIRYTLTGEDPTETSAEYDSNHPITLTETTTIKAKAFKEGLNPSEVASATYTKIIQITSYDIDFENELSAYVNWNFDNIARVSTAITAHAGTYYGNTDGKTTASITTKTAIAAPGMLTFYISKESGNTSASSWKAQYSTDKETWTDVDPSFDAKGMSKGVWNECVVDLSDYTNVYVRISYGSSTAIRAIDDISLEMASAVKKPTISGTTPFVTSTTVTLECETTGATIYYTTDGTDPKLGSVYSGALNITETTTVKAIAKVDDEWSTANEKTFSQVDIWTVARANTELASSSPINGKYVRGIISQIDSYDSNSITYWISDDGSTTSQLEVYKGKNLNEEDFEAITDLTVGDIVIVYGNLKIYKGTNEFDQGNYLVSKEAPAVAAPVFTPDGGGFVVSTDVTIACTTTGSTIYYTLDGTAPTNESTQYTEAIALTDDATIKAIAYTGENHSIVITKNFTKTAPKTVAEAYDELTEDPINNVAVEGIVYKVDRCTEGGTAQYWISDEEDPAAVTDNTKVLEIYNGNGLNNQPFAENGIRVGDKVIVFGNLKIYNSTKEFDSGSRLLSLERKTVSSVVVSGTPEKTSYKLGDEFDPNGLTVTITYNDQSTTTVAVTECTWEKTPATFIEAGTGKSVSVKATYDEVQSVAYLVEDLTVLASHNVVYNTTGSQGTTPVDENTYEAGATVTLLSAAGLTNAGYIFNGWNATYVDGNNDTQTLEIEDNQFTMPDFDVTVTATWARKLNDKWVKVTSTDELVDEDVSEIIIVNTDATYALGEQRSNNRGAVEIDVTPEGVVKISSAVTVFTLGVISGNEGNKYTFKDGSAYLCAVSSGSNNMKTQTTLDDNGKWTINIIDGLATITATGTFTRNRMRYNPNNGSPLFSCYATSSTTGTLVTIYKKAPKVQVEENQTTDIEDVSANSDIEVKAGGTLNIDAAKTVSDLTVESGAKVVLDGVNNYKLTITGTFTFSATMAGGLASSDFTGANASNIELGADAEVFFDITLGAGATSAQWHAFTVPFPVDAMNGVFDLDGNQLINETNYAIMSYHGDIRANGGYGWQKDRGILVPGTFYLMTVDGGRTTYRFKKASGALVAQNSKTLTAYSGTGAGSDQGWNGVGNPNLFFGTVAYIAYVLDPTSYTFVDYDPGEMNFAVGTPFFIQTTTPETMSMDDVDENYEYYSPARTQTNAIENIKVFFGNDEYKDRLTVSASEDALNEYQIGKDLVEMKMTNAPRVAQITANAYNSKLTRVYAPLANNQAIYDLDLFAPAAGTYSISAQQVEGATLYVTYNGAIVWNLSLGDYELDLTRGTTTGYGLLLVAQPNQMPTGLDTTEGVDGDAVQKILLNGQLYILRDGHLFDAVGHEMK